MNSISDGQNESGMADDKIVESSLSPLGPNLNILHPLMGLSSYTTPPRLDLTSL